MSKPTGYVIYRGPSRIDGSPIVVIALTGGSTNVKTGNMVQTYILREDIDPVAAVKQGADVSICGDCKHRGNGIDGTGRTCYVNLGHGPSSVYRAYKRGRYPHLAPAVAARPDSYAAAPQELHRLGEGRVIRLGTYGDPAAVPRWVWRDLVAYAKGHTGYTHQWRTSPHLAGIVMASADSPSEAEEARAAGWRTFRVRTADQPMLERESVCPASAEAGKKAQCAQCRACDGAGSGKRGSIAIIVHGALARRFQAAA
jgi:hypothetical protein